MFRPIQIKAVANGFVVEVGCQTFVFTSVAGLIDNLRDYLSDPDATEARFLREALNIKHTPPGTGPAQQAPPQALRTAREVSPRASAWGHDLGPTTNRY